MATGSPSHATASYQRRTRQQHAQERAQDYAEAIADLIAEHGEARATDIAKALGVTHVTVIRTVQRSAARGTRDHPALSLHFSHRSRAQARHHGQGPP